MNPHITVPDMCQTHRVLLVRQCHYGPNDTWQALLIATQIALFQGATCDEKVYAEVEGRVENFSRIGCLACRKPDLFGVLINEVQCTPRKDHIGMIKRLGEKWIEDARKRP